MKKSRNIGVFLLILIALTFISVLNLSLAKAIEFIPPTPEEGSEIDEPATVNISGLSGFNNYVFTSFNNDLVLYMKGEETKSGLSEDLSSYEREGEFIGSSTTTQGLFGQAFRTNTDSYILIPEGTHHNLYYKTFLFEEKTGDINCHQGLSYNGTWLWCYNDNRVDRRNPSHPFDVVVSNNNLQQFGFPGQNHFGDGDLHNGSIWIANSRWESCDDYDTNSLFKINAMTLEFEENIMPTGEYGNPTFAGITLDDNYAYLVDFCDGSRILKFLHNGTFIEDITLTYEGFLGTKSSKHQGITLREDDEMYGEDVFYISADGNIDRIYVFNKDGKFLNIVKSFEPDENTPSTEGLDYKNSDRLAIIIDKDGNQEAEFFKPYLGGTTISAWFYKENNNGQFPGIVSIGTSLNNRNAFLGLNNNEDRIYCGYEEDGGRDSFITGSETQIESGQWYHAVYTWDGSEIRCYINGMLEASGYSNLVPADGEGIVIGSNAIAGNELNGMVDEAIILNRALNEGEVLSLYDATVNNYEHTTGLLKGFNTLKAYSSDVEDGFEETEQRTFYSTVSYIPEEPVIVPCETDFNGDGFVNGADLATLLSNWNTPNSDVTNDSMTNGADLAFLLSQWGFCGSVQNTLEIDEGSRDLIKNFFEKQNKRNLGFLSLVL